MLAMLRHNGGVTPFCAAATGPEVTAALQELLCAGLIRKVQAFEIVED